MATRPLEWDAVYVAGTPPPWDIGRPQPAFVRLADSGLLCGRVLDVGCGTGEHTLLAAAHGADAVGADVSPSAIEQARGKAAERGVNARFEVADTLNLGQLRMTFDTVIDSRAVPRLRRRGARPVRHQPGAGAAVRRQLLPAVLQRPPARRLGPPPGSPGRARHRVRRRLERHRHRGGRVRDQPPDPVPRRPRPGWPPSAGCAPSNLDVKTLMPCGVDAISATAVPRPERHVHARRVDMSRPLTIRARRAGRRRCRSGGRPRGAPYGALGWRHPPPPFGRARSCPVIGVRGGHDRTYRRGPPLSERAVHKAVDRLCKHAGSTVHRRGTALCI